MIHIAKGFGVANKAEIDVFIEFPCLFVCLFVFDDRMYVCNMIFDSSAFSKSSLNMWKIMVHVLLKSGLEDFENYFSKVLNECNGVVV